MKKTMIPLVAALVVALVTVLACTAPYPRLPEEPDAPAEPMTNIVGHAINYEQLGFARPDNMELSDRSLEFTNATPQHDLTVSASEDVVYRYGYISIERGSWRRFELTGGTHYGDWIADNATTTLTLQTGNFTLQPGQNASDNHILTFSCTYLSDRKAWDCHNDQWQLHQFNASVLEQCAGGCEYEDQCYDDGEYLASIDSICEEGVWREMPSDPSDPNSVPSTDETAGALIVNHTAVERFDDIPTSWLEEAKEDLTIHYAHTSHGSQLNSGASYIESDVNSSFKFIRRESSTEGLPPQENPPGLRMYDGNPPETYIAPDDYWDGSSALDRTRAVADTGHYNVSMWSWCGQQASNSEATVQRYLDNMALLASEYPNMTFVLMTGHLGSQNSQYQYSDSERDVLKRNNDMVRAFAREHNMTLFDFADIEGHNGTSYCYTNDYHDAYNGLIVECEWPSSPSFSCAHSAGPNCVRKGKAFWYMMARLAGWDGS